MITRLRQRYNHDPDNGKYGDCFRTAVACLIGASEPEAVPHFYLGVSDDDAVGLEKAENMIKDWLEMVDRFIVEVQFPAPNIESALTLAGQCSSVPYLLWGESWHGNNHVVVCQDDKVIHDPAVAESHKVASLVGPIKSIGGWKAQWIGKKP